jgi:hypothetical protein
MAQEVHFAQGGDDVFFVYFQVVTRAVAKIRTASTKRGLFVNM